ncbi:MAG: HlyD family efflux transporter periplasmic adaptor subunit [Dysgonamonadaceae bacterium]|jgi:HlyD family secretion protein|nr:HlyD family efflux transporter periplasmic adaptor subunit [Dysgonamonadaceae bacterium]
MKRGILFFMGLFFLSNCGKQAGNYDASGTFEATEVIVSSQVAGQVMTLDVEEGQSVRAYEPVGLVDTVQLYLKRKQLLAGMKAVDSRSYNISLQIASLKQQIEKQQTELARFNKLLNSNAATQKQVDDIQSSIDVLQRQLAAQTESLRNSNRSVAAESLSMQAQVEQINDMLNKSIISSPLDGVVLSKYVERGEVVGQGKALFKVADIDRIFLRAYITADLLSQIKLNQQITVFADFGKNEMRPYTGTVTWISDKAEFTPRTILTKDERANLVYAVKVAVENDGYLKIGMYGQLIIDK